MMGGYVYFIRDVTNYGHGIGLVKIGFSRDPDKREGQIRRTRPGRQLVLAALLDGDMNHERALHQRFAVGHVGHEWFRADTPGLDDFMHAAEHFDSFHTPDLCAPAPCDQCREILEFYAEVGC